MYIVKEMRNVVKIPPMLFDVPRNEAIANELNKKLANKVMNNLGLCIALHDITHIGDSYIIPGDGSAHIKVTFRYLIFRPIINEVIEGKVKLCDSEGIHVSLDFFDDILIPQRHMPDFSIFNPVQSTWIWKYKQSKDSEPHDMPTEKGDDIRFRVVELIFKDTTPTPADNKNAAVDAIRNKPFKIVGQTSDAGLGLPSWWSGTGRTEGEEDDDDEEEAEDEEEEAEDEAE